jgi:hypothetical protein
MIRFFLLLLLPFALSASSILSYNIYDRTDRVDVMITFDTPYTGTIKQSISTQKIIIKLEDAKIESAKTKKLSSNFLNAITMTPMAGYTQIVASVPPSVELQASKTSDSYGLRLRFTNNIAQSKPIAKQSTQEEINPFAALPTKQDNNISQSYYIVIFILVTGIVLLFYLKRKMNTSQQQAPKQGSSWLFKTDAKHNDAHNPNEVSIRFQKNINNENSVVMLDFGTESYLVLMGHNNILLDKFTDNKPVTQSDFETILQNRHQELDAFLKVDKQSSKEPLQSYKEKASSISYDV